MQTIYLDLSNRGVIPAVYAKQNDVGRKFKAVLTNAGSPYHPEAGSVFSVWYSGASGGGNYTDIGGRPAFSVSGNEVAVELIVQMLRNPGEGVLCLVLNSAGGNQLGLWNIPYLVEGVPGAGSEAARQYYTAFSNAVEGLAYPDASLSVPGKAADAAATGAALAQKAPAGYGLGLTSGAYVDDCNMATAFGLYSVSYATANNPLNAYGSLLVLPHNDTEKCQILSSSYNKSILVRYETGGVWGQWEWGNPPMVLGVEYRTTERYNGKAVYVKTLNVGYLPNSSVKDTGTWGGSGSFNPIKYNAFAQKENGLDAKVLPYDDGTNKISASVTNWSVHLYTVGDFSQQSVIITIWYTKD